MIDTAHAWPVLIEKHGRGVVGRPPAISAAARLLSRSTAGSPAATVCREIVSGRRKMLVEMATGTGKTRTAAALLKRLFEANWAMRALFVVDRNTLAIQAEDAFAEHLPHLRCYRVPRTGCRFASTARRCATP